jgi:hypothetical protein
VKLRTTKWRTRDKNEKKKMLTGTHTHTHTHPPTPHQRKNRGSNKPVRNREITGSQIWKIQENNVRFHNIGGGRRTGHH